MLDRLRIVMEHRGLSPTQLADQIGVPRPVISHVLSGRNKLSLEVAQKLLFAFPDISAEWFLTGNGEKLKVIATEAPSIAHNPEKKNGPGRN